MDVQKAFKTIIDNTDENDVIDQVDENKEDYVNADWADEFDNVHDAYEEQGRGQAECDAISGAIGRFYKDFLNNDEYCELYDMVAEEWNLTT